MAGFNFNPMKPTDFTGVVRGRLVYKPRAMRRGLSGKGGPRRWRKRRIAARLAGKTWVG